MRVAADLDRCQGHGLCHMSAPDVFDLNEEGHVIVKIEGKIPEELEQVAALAVSSCPEVALSSGE